MGGKFNKVSIKSAAFSPVASTEKATTALGGKGFLRDEKSELYLLGVANMVGEETFHEKADDRDDRFSKLVRSVSLVDMEWLTGFGGWLRSDVGMRTAPLVLAAIAVQERIRKGLHVGNADLIDAVLQRADEPGEFIAYWRHSFGRALPKAVKKGVGRAVTRLYNERSYLRWDSSASAYHFADVVDIVCPTPKAEWQNALFRFLLDQRHHGDGRVGEYLSVLDTNAVWKASLASAKTKNEFEALISGDIIRDAGLKWENVLSAMGSKVDKAKLWEAMIPHMSYFALIRNLRNFDQAGVSDEVAEKVAVKLADADEVRGSKIFPMSIHAAYRSAPSLRWGWALERALKHSLANVPVLKGRTLILVDTSTSMQDTFSRDGSVKRWDAAVLFGLALAERCEAVDVVSYSSAQYYRNDPKGTRTKVFTLNRGEGLLKGITRWNDTGFFLGGGTDTTGAVRQHFDRHDRVIILTDEQAGSDPQATSDAIPKSVPLHTMNLAGYRVGHGESGVRNRHVYGGLTDKMFVSIARIEAGMSTGWPWEK